MQVNLNFQYKNSGSSYTQCWWCSLTLLLLWFLMVQCFTGSLDGPFSRSLLYWNYFKIQAGSRKGGRTGISSFRNSVSSLRWAYLWVLAGYFGTICGKDVFILNIIFFVSCQLLWMSIVKIGQKSWSGFPYVGAQDLRLLCVSLRWKFRPKMTAPAFPRLS